MLLVVYLGELTSFSTVKCSRDPVVHLRIKKIRYKENKRENVKTYFPFDSSSICNILLLFVPV